MGSLPPNWRNQPPYDDEDDNYPPAAPQGGNYPPAQNYPPTGQSGQNYPPINLDDPRAGNYPPPPPPQGTGGNYPPQGNYPPAGPNYPPQGAGGYPPTGRINLDEPQYGQPPDYPPQTGAAGYPPQGNYPPSPPPQSAGSNYPPAGANYPPQGTGGYPPTTGRINLDEPQYGQAPNYPPAGAGYPPQGTGGYPPQAAGPIDLGDPRHVVSGRGAPPRQDFPSEGQISLDDPRLGGRGAMRDEPNFDSRRREKPKRTETPAQLGSRPARTGFGLSERQVEYLAWGSTVILLGVSLMMSVAGSARFLTLIFPLVAGGILMTASVYQRVVKGWHVGPLTWLTAILLVSYTITLQLSAGGANIFQWVAYFLGTLTIMTGVILFLQVFRKH